MSGNVQALRKCQISKYTDRKLNKRQNKSCMQWEKVSKNQTFIKYSIMEVTLTTLYQLTRGQNSNQEHKQRYLSFMLLPLYSQFKPKIVDRKVYRRFTKKMRNN